MKSLVTQLLMNKGARSAAGVSSAVVHLEDLAAPWVPA